MKFLKVIACIFMACIGFIGGFIGNYYVSQPESEIFIDGSIAFHFMFLGNKYSGDSIYIQCGSDDILIDAGSRSDSASTITNYVDQYVTDGKLEYVIATHSDEDHISAFPSVLEYYDTDMIIDFPKAVKETSILTKYISARDQEVANGAKHYTALECYNEQNGAQRVYELSGGVKMEILYNYYYDHDTSNNNDNSVCLLFRQGDNCFLFTGDLEENGEKQLVEFYNTQGNPLPKCKLYKAGHHGSYTASTTILMEQIRPEIVVVSCVAGSKYYTKKYNENTFPAQAVINNIAPYTDKVYVTGIIEIDNDGNESAGAEFNGNIVLFYNKADTPEMSFSSSDKILKESDWFKANRTCPDAWK